MATKFAAGLAVAAAFAAVPASSIAGGDVQQYQATTTYTQQPYAPAPGPYMQPSGMYYGSYGCSPCATAPYGQSYGYGYGYQAGGGLFGNPVFAAGVLGLGLGYIIWH